MKPQPTIPDRAAVDPSRIRTIPEHFAWADHRLRDMLGRLSLEEIALLFFLHLAADRLGCSYWSDPTLAKRIGILEGEVIQARYGLIARDLVAYRYPLYQVLPVQEGRR